MKSVRYLSVFFIFMFFTCAAVASEKSEIAIEKAKLSFSEGDYREAGKLLDQVLVDDPGNFEALHYRGLCELALKRPLAAVSSLEKAASIEPENIPARLDLAWARIEAGQEVRALGDIDYVIEREPDNGKAYYLKGHALLLDRRYSDAIEAFARVPDLAPELKQDALFYQGVCSMKLDNETEAERAFTEAESIDPGSRTGRAAADNLEALRKGPEEKRRYGAMVSAFYQYDTNVVPVADEDILLTQEGTLVVSTPDGQTEELDDIEDGRYVVWGQLGVYPYSTERLDTGIQYMIYSSWHEDADIYNLQVHIGNVYGRYTFSAMETPLTAQLAYIYQYAGLGEDYDYYSTINRVMPALFIQWNNRTLTEVSAYYESEVFDEDYEGWDEYERNNTAGEIIVAQHFLFGNDYLSLRAGGKYIVENAQGDAYDVARMGALLDLKLSDWNNLSGLIQVDYEDRDYMNHPVDRHDHRAYFTVRLEYQIIKYLSVFASANAADYESNIEVFDYERNIYSVGLTGSL